MNTRIAIALIVLFASSGCGTSPSTCACHVVRVLSMGNDSPINDATIPYVSPAQPPGTGVFLPSAGSYALGGPTCFRGVVTFRVEHSAYVSQDVTVTITRDVAGGSDQACRSNPPLDPLVVRLLPP